MANQAQTEEAEQTESRGTVDLVSVLYVLGGVPGLILFFVGLFLAVATCGELNIQIPA